MWPRTSGQYCWGETFGYDIWANLLSIGGITPQYSGCTQESGLSVGATGKNQISGDTYDAAGNLLSGPGMGPFAYDAENHLKTAGGVTYTYDGDGKRVQKSSGKLYWYGMGGDPLDESDGAGNIIDEYVFFGGKRMARRNVSSGNIFYYFADHLGTSRVILQAGQTTPCYDADFYPFGGERIVTNTCTQNYKFTGYERDAETGLDYAFARYYNSRLGRFMTADPLGGDITGPQSLNRYAYVLNNPINAVDPLGLDDPCIVEPCGQVGSARGGSCTLDGIDVGCDLVFAALDSGAAALCPGNDCSYLSIDPRNGRFSRLMAMQYYKTDCVGPTLETVFGNCGPLTLVWGFVPQDAGPVDNPLGSLVRWIDFISGRRPYQGFHGALQSWFVDRRPCPLTLHSLQTQNRWL